MATVSCRCCGVEISAEAPLCWECAGRPAGLYVTYPLKDWERRRIPATCQHRRDERLVEEPA